ncbi:Holliday junction branch migration protein RuvA [Nodosilinea sp. LEGE 07088]|uniref:Holliday junction branch migration protein RuvA n=1 Tax=Nodosilinea sp. LEGE 07088 TaxID=2777968 RepID=UPI00187ED728|nr:Holliday junction branch migration protein RuvA [Nodosilinea sp. LEGE 07088]MBE9138728.1 Holliday junction branch migration protein RuvA [Nodosilinea sp. LEGE 07088]
MISYLKGVLADLQKPGNHKIIVTLDVNQIGYDMQVPARQLSLLPSLGEVVQLFTHLYFRDDQAVLFGFGQRQERDLFRLLISVSGIGPQMALALIDTLGQAELTQAVVSGNTRLLSRTPGVGTKTAERLVLELKAKLQDWQTQSGIGLMPTAAPAPNLYEEVEATLSALGYGQSEILQALQAVGRNSTLQKTADPESWVRDAIAWLSQ